MLIWFTYHLKIPSASWIFLKAQTYHIQIWVLRKGESKTTCFPEHDLNTHTQSLQLDFMLNLGHMLILFNCRNFPEYSLVFTTLWMTLSFKLLLLISDFQVLSEISGWFKISAQEM